MKAQTGFVSGINGKTFYRPDMVKGKIHRKTVTNRHLVRKFASPKYQGDYSWGINAEALRDLKAKGVEEIRIYHKNDDLTYVTTVEFFMKNGTLDKLGNAEWQYFLGLMHFQKVEGKA
jgi:hypothetical protein